MSGKKKLRILFFLSIAIFLFIYMFYLGKVISYEDDYIANADAILVLGYTLDEGMYPSEFLENRMETALSLYDEGYSDNIIVSGGKGPRDKIAVGEVMYNWFLSRGVPSENLFLEPLASNTYENFAYAKKIAIENNFESIIVVTNDFHMYRSLLIGEEFFNNPMGKESIVPMSMEKFFCILKEPLSIFKYYLLNRGTISSLGY